ncbi:Predicted membrane protein [Chryseobacterium sp. RU37D]|nr:Predicted membrane protein [Chryseobacterium sp. RU37D]
MGFGYFFWLMANITLEYVPLRTDVSFLMIKQTEVVERKEYLYFFYTHVYACIFVLFSGFLAIIKKDFGLKNFHKNAGKIYIFLILFFAAPSGIYMGIFANGGVYSKISFVILGCLWWVSTLKAFQSAKRKKFAEHKQWMWRSFALTISAITLRMWKVIIVYLFHSNPMDVYQIIAWLSWVPNILLIEYLLVKKYI